MVVRAILLDFDGVLLDSFREGMRRIRRISTLRKHEEGKEDLIFNRETRARLISKWGLAGIELLMEGLQIEKERAERLYVDWESLDKLEPPPLIPGAREVLVWLRKNGFLSALITSRHRENLLEVLDELDIGKEFAVITAKEDAGPHRKPHPRAFDRTLTVLHEQAGIFKEECIFVGDTPADTVAGHAAELETLVVQTGPYLVEHARDYPVTLGNILMSIDDLPQWIEKHHEGPLVKLYL